MMCAVDRCGLRSRDGGGRLVGQERERERERDGWCKSSSGAVVQWSLLRSVYVWLGRSVSEDAVGRRAGARGATGAASGRELIRDTAAEQAPPPPGGQVENHRAPRDVAIRRCRICSRRRRRVSDDRQFHAGNRRRHLARCTRGERTFPLPANMSLCVCVFVCPRSYLRNYTSDVLKLTPGGKTGGVVCSL